MCHLCPHGSTKMILRNGIPRLRMSKFLVEESSWFQDTIAGGHGVVRDFVHLEEWISLVVGLAEYLVYRTPLIKEGLTSL